MMNKLVCFFAFFISLVAVSQTTKLEIIESVEFREQISFESIVAMHSSTRNERGIIKFSKQYMSFDVFGKNLEPLSTKVIELQKKENYQSTLYFENEIKIFTVVSPKKRERQLYCYTFDLNTREHTKALLFERILEKNQSLFSGKNKRQTSFAKSPNGKFIAISTDDIKKTSNSYTIHLFNAENLELVLQKSYQKDVEKYFLSNDMAVDNMGNVYVIGKLFLNGKKDKIGNKANYELVINKISEGEVRTAKIQLEDYFINSLSFASIQKNITLVGFYSEKNSTRMKGVSSFVLDLADLSMLEKKSSQLPNEVYTGLYGYRENVSEELGNFYVDHVLEDSKGDIFIVAEEFFVTTSYVNNGQMGGYQTTTTHYDDVLIVKLNKNGGLEWGNSIFKRSTRPSYNAFILDDELHLILNSGKNLKKKEDGRTKVSKGWFESSALYDIVLNNKGYLSYDKIQDNKNRNYYLPAFGTFTSDNSFIMMNKKSNDSNMRRLMLLR